MGCVSLLLDHELERSPLMSLDRGTGHILYPAAIALARFLELHASTLLHGPDGGKGKGRGKNVLELGAGGGLPGLVAALEGAGQVRDNSNLKPLRQVDSGVDRLCTGSDI